jgi:hypothetical protein
MRFAVPVFCTIQAYNSDYPDNFFIVWLTKLFVKNVDAELRHYKLTSFSMHTVCCKHIQKLRKYVLAHKNIFMLSVTLCFANMLRTRMYAYMYNIHYTHIFVLVYSA